MKYNEPWNAYNTYGGTAEVGYMINDNMSVTAFGNYESAPFWSNARRGGYGAFGGYMTFKTNNDKWGVDVGAQNVRDFQTGRSATLPIIRPFYNYHGQKLGIDLGGLLYQLFENMSINTGNTISASAQMKLTKNGQTLSGVSLGDGPVDAAFLAIESILGRHYELDDFQIQAVTEGREAMGESVVKLRSGGKLYSGRGISTDIIGASVHAYLNAINKIVYEEAANA